MSDFNTTHTLPGDENFHLFEQLPSKLYDKFVLSRINKPEKQHLKQCVLVIKNKVPVARAAFYINPNLKYNNAKTACIGSYECIDDQETSGRLFDAIKKLAKQHKVQWLIGPMEGSTWSNYRFSTHHNAPDFFMEPHHHLYYNDHFTKAGFNAIANYLSSLDETLFYDLESIQEIEHNYLEKGLTLRNLNLDDFGNELQKIGKFSIDQFSSNFLYSPIQPNDFVEKYKPLKAFFNPQFIKVLENKNGEIQAFIFAIKDHLDSSNETLIIKSVVRKKDASIKHVGAYLAQKINYLAKKSGYNKVIHAFMIDTNASHKISTQQSASTYKAYALYGMKIN